MMKKIDVDIYGYDFVADKKEIISMGVSYHSIDDGIEGFDVLMFLNNHEKNTKLNCFALVRQMNDIPIFFDGWSQFQKRRF